MEAPAVATQRAEELERVRFEAGAAFFLFVLDAQRKLREVAAELARVYTDRATALISACKAMRIGWNEAEAEQQLAQWRRTGAMPRATMAYGRTLKAKSRT